MKYFLLLLTLILSLASSFLSSNIALADNHDSNNTQSNQTTINLNEQQLQKLIQSIFDTKQESIKIEPENDTQGFKVEIVTAQQKWYEDALNAAILSAFLGALIPFSFNFIANRSKSQQQQKINTFELAKEWNSQNMRESRTLAWRKFSKGRIEKIINNGESERDKNFQDYYDNDNQGDNSNKDVEYAINMLRIVDFFKQIRFLYENNFIDKNLAQTIFRGAYIDWRDKCFISQDKTLENSGGKVSEDLKDTFKIIYKLDWLADRPQETICETISNLWLMRKSENKEIKRDEQKNINKFINIQDISNRLYKQVYSGKEKPESTKALAKIIDKKLKDKQLIYQIDISFQDTTQEDE